jgi:hypothetical protein
MTDTATRRRRLRITGLQAGVVMAIAAVSAGAFFEVRPPEAYGICMACHGRDLVNWIGHELTGNGRLIVAPASVVFPLLTVVGVLLGARLAAAIAGEFRFRRSSRPARHFLYGVVVMNAGLLAAGCSTRLVLRASAGDQLGLIGVAAMVVGIVLATLLLRRRALR